MRGPRVPTDDAVRAVAHVMHVVARFGHAVRRLFLFSGWRVQRCEKMLKMLRTPRERQRERERVYREHVDGRHQPKWAGGAPVPTGLVNVYVQPTDPW
jgi:intergrase/recombinase